MPCKCEKGPGVPAVDVESGCCGSPGTMWRTRDGDGVVPHIGPVAQKGNRKATCLCGGGVAGR